MLSKIVDMFKGKLQKRVCVSITTKIATLKFYGFRLSGRMALENVNIFKEEYSVENNSIGKAITKL